MLRDIRKAHLVRQYRIARFVQRSRHKLDRETTCRRSDYSTLSKRWASGFGASSADLRVVVALEEFDRSLATALGLAVLCLNNDSVGRRFF